jgi:hypothetical protein
MEEETAIITLSIVNFACYSQFKKQKDFHFIYPINTTTAFTFFIF